MMLEWDGVPQYINWEDGPRYISTKLSTLLENTDILTNKMYVKCEQDMDITFEEATALKEEIIAQYNVREFKLQDQKNITIDHEDIDISNFQTIDEIFTNEIIGIQSNSINPSTLLSIYNDL
jgi:hypothetical protein